MTTKRTLVGIPACTRLVSGYIQHATPARYGQALIQAVNAVPVLIPPEGEAMLPLLDRLDGILFDGSPSNIMPTLYGVDYDATPDFHDLNRDLTSLPLVRGALARGIPILGVCRGLQEINVALGGTLFQEVHKLAGRMDHRSGEGDNEFKFRPQHEVTLSGEMEKIVGTNKIQVNSLHGQAIDQLAPGLVAEGVAPDGTIEAVRVAEADGFAMAVQWHPEWEVMHFPDRLRLFQAFGTACDAYAARR